MVWGIGAVRTSEELRVGNRLRVEGVDFYCPQIRVRGRVGPRRRVGYRDLPAFPGYLLLYWPTVQNLEALDLIPGFYGLMRRASGIFHHLSDDAVEAIRGAEMRRMLMAEFTEDAPFLIGDKVRVEEGPFTGYEGYVVGMQSKGVMVAGGAFRYGVRIPTKMLRPAPE